MCQVAASALKDGLQFPITELGFRGNLTLVPACMQHSSWDPGMSKFALGTLSQSVGNLAVAAEDLHWNRTSGKANWEGNMRVSCFK